MSVNIVVTVISIVACTLATASTTSASSQSSTDGQRLEQFGTNNPAQVPTSVANQ